MKVTIIEEQPWNKHKKIDALHKLRNDIGETAFRSAVAKVEAIDLYEAMYWKGKKISVSDIHFIVNMNLRTLGCEEVSYATIQQLIQSHTIGVD